MIKNFIKRMGKAYLGQIAAMLITAFFVFAYVSDLGLSDPLKTLSEFTNSPQFFYNLITNSAFGYLAALPLAIIPFLVCWVVFKKYFFKYRIQQIEKHSPAHFLHDLVEGAFFLVSYELLTIMRIKLEAQGYVKLYEDIHAFEWYYIPLSFAALIVFEDFWFYWVHRTMHHKWLYKWVHASHHVSVDSTPFTQNAFHFVEGLVVALGGFIPLFFVPTWSGVYLAYYLFGAFVNIVAHSGYEFYPMWTLSWKTTATHHNMHHQHFDGNYGTHFTFWDKIMGTEFKDYEARFMEIKERISMK
jgi:sterol desaturase/sphingolipid hydroxylase (fatty acid hydroxylase superfamily)